MDFALKDQRDGHDFVADAFAKGACAAVVAWDWSIPADLTDKALLRVGDPRQQALSARRQVAEA